MSKELLENFALLAASEGGVAKLRELILSLAVRGKLVPQAPTDEPASVLLERIRAEKERLVADGKIKRDKPLPPIGEEEKPFKLPEAWEWVRLSDLLPEFQNGASSRGEKDGISTTVLRLADIKNGKISFDDTRQIDLAPSGAMRYRLYQSDILVIRVNGSADIIGRFVRVESETEAIYCDHFIRMRIDGNWCYSPYLRLLGGSRLVRERIHGLFITTAGQKTVNQSHINSLLFPLPPLPEQSRIVAKVEALMALCDRLEAQQGDAARVQTLWTQAALDQLAESGDADEFARNWQALSEHFDTLFATPASIDALDATLLQLAVRGKLVPHNLADEPASELIKKIRAEKDRLIAEGKSKRDKPLPPIADDEKPFELPKGWKWARFGHIAEIASNLVAPRDHLNSPQVAPDCIQKGTGKLIAHRTVREAGITSPNHQFYAGQILYSKIRPSLSKAVLIDFSGLCSADMYPVSSKIEPSFLLRVILSALFLNQVVQAENRVKMPKLNQEALNAFLVPTPPLPEQSRIVAKLDELLALTRTLRARLTDARAVQSRLASALVDEVTA